MQKYKIKTTTRFRKAYDALYEDDKDKVDYVINTIAAGETLPPRYRDHPLKGNKKGMRDCHVKPDLVLFYKLDKGELILTAVELGSHSNLFH